MARCVAMGFRGNAGVGRRVRSFSNLGLLFLASWLGGGACSKDLPQSAGLAHGCALNSECDSPLVCAFQRCHIECAEDRDCKVGEERCVRGEDGNVCQLDQEIQCTSDRNCPGKQTCAADGECRDSCRSADDCTPTQICANSGECASSDPTKDLVDAKGNIQRDPFGSSAQPDLTAGAGGSSNGDDAGAGGTTTDDEAGAGGTMHESTPDEQAGAGMGHGGAGSPVTDPTDITTTDCAKPGPATTHDGETLSKDASWQGEHVITGTLRIQAALDLAPCTLIRLTAGAAIRVDAGGALHAIGTSKRAITFTSAKNAKAAGDWTSIQVYADASNDSRFEQVIVEYGTDSALGIRDNASASFSSVLVRHVTGSAIAWWPGVKIAEFEHVAVEDASAYALSVYSNSVGLIGSTSSHGSGHDEILVWDNDVSQPAIWKNHGIPYHITDGNLSVLAHLELEAGATLKMENYSLVVGKNGAIVSKGTANEPVTFTSAKTSPAAGDWGNLSFSADSSSDSLLENAIIEYAGEDAIRSYGGSTSGFANVTLRHTKGVGVNVDCTAKLSRFEAFAVEDAGAQAFYVCSNTVGSLKSFSSTGSVHDEVWVYQEPLTKAAIWTNQGIPYRLVSAGASVGDIRASLTLNPGVVLLMDTSTGLNVGTGGSLKAKGSASSPVTIKSSLAVPSAGSWGRLSVSAGANADSVLSYTQISDGSSGALTLSGSTIALDNVTFMNSASCDVAVSGGTLTQAAGSTNTFTTCP